MFISAAYVRRSCLRDGLDERRHYRTLLTHGITHLLGYDHVTEADYRLMRDREEALLAQLLAAESRGGAAQLR